MRTLVVVANVATSGLQRGEIGEVADDSIVQALIERGHLDLVAHPDPDMPAPPKVDETPAEPVHAKPRKARAAKKA